MTGDTALEASTKAVEAPNTALTAASKTWLQIDAHDTTVSLRQTITKVVRWSLAQERSVSPTGFK
jgi:hypothetical protein